MYEQQSTDETRKRPTQTTRGRLITLLALVFFFLVSRTARTGASGKLGLCMHKVRRRWEIGRMYYHHYYYYLLKGIEYPSKASINALRYW